MILFLSLVAGLLCSSSNSNAFEVVDVSPHCPSQIEQSCVTISTALANLSSNTELHLREGHHQILAQLPVISALSNVSIIGTGKVVNLTCAKDSGLIFSEVQNLVITEVTISFCGSSGGQNFDLVIFELQRLKGLEIKFKRLEFYAIVIINSLSVTLSNMTISGSRGLGLLAVNVMQSFTLSHVVVSDNGGGGAVLLYSDSDHNVSATKVDIADCKFVGNSYTDSNSVPINVYGHEYQPLISSGGGLTIILASTFIVEVDVERSLFGSNRAEYGGGVHLGLFAGLHDSAVQFIECVFQDNGIDQDSSLGGALYAILGVGLSHSSALLRNVTISMCKSSFICNRANDGGSLYLFVIQPTDSTFVRVESSLFEANTATLASVIAAYAPTYQHNDVFTVFLTNSTIRDNLQASEESESATAVSINHGWILLEENKFLSNQGSGLTCLACVVHVKGENMFYNNTGTNGGALHLINGLLRLYNNSHLSLHNNTAKVYGGGIFVSGIRNLDKCFIVTDEYFLFENCTFAKHFHTLLDFYGNTAPIASMIYNGYGLRSCNWIYIIDSNYNIYQHLYSVCSNSELFSFADEPTGVSKLSSPSVEFQLLKSPQSLMPGQMSSVNLTSYDIFNQTVSDIVVFRILPRSEGEIISGNDGLTGVDSNVSFVISGIQNTTVDIEIRSRVPLSQARTTFSVQLTACSTGYIYDESIHRCECDRRFASIGVVCNVEGVFKTPPGLWLGRGRDGVLMWGYCPKEYCTAGRSNSIPNEDYSFQCSMNSHRTGFLCGTCKTGFSVTLSTSKDCRKCSNSWLAMLLVILFLGVVIIGFLSFFHISIAVGYINSVFFYSNIISIYAAHFVPNIEWRFLFIVADLLSLKFNFNACLYNGMTELVAVLFQYAFVAYIFFLMGIIYVVASRYSLLDSYSHAPSKTAVILLVMCYMLLIDACNKSLSFVKVYSLSGDQTLVLWKGDTSLAYFASIHGSIGVLALLVIMFLLLPFTAIVIHPRCSYKIPLLAKLKPIYDAAWAPFRPEARWWFGIRLILRWVLFICAAVLETYQSIFALELILVALLLVQSRLRPFTAESVNLLDNSLLVIVLSLALGVSYSLAHSNDPFLLTYTAIFTLVFYSVLFIVFVDHFYIRFPHFLSDMKRVYSTMQRRCCSRQYVLYEEDTSPPEVSSTEVNIAGLRENPDLNETEVVTTTGLPATNAMNMSAMQYEDMPSLNPIFLSSEVDGEVGGSDTDRDRFYTCRDDPEDREENVHT